MAPKKFVPNYEIAVGLHKGHKVTKYKPDRLKPSRTSHVIILTRLFQTKYYNFFLLILGKQTR
jgi:hypothetical protein